MLICTLLHVRMIPSRLADDKEVVSKTALPPRKLASGHSEYIEHDLVTRFPSILARRGDLVNQSTMAVDEHNGWPPKRASILKV